MVNRSNESLSALMDGETDSFELRRTLERLDSEPELSEKWQRYHMIGAVMRNEEVSMPEMDLRSSIMDAIDKEESYHHSSTNHPKQTDSTHSLSGWLKPFASMAVAASVTAVVIFGVQRVNLEDQNLVTATTTAPSYTLPSGPVSQGFMQAQFGNRTLATNSQQEADIIRLPQGLERYVEQHKYMQQQPEGSRWHASWLPEGFDGLRRDIMPHSEVQIYSNGRNAFTVCIEDYGYQTVPEGAVQSGHMVAVGKRMGKHFVTVVGDVPLMIAERIATSVKPR
jgi:negative regulator of sigma E activity